MIDLVIGVHDGAYSLEILRGILDFAVEVDVDVVVSSYTPDKVSQVDHDEWARELRRLARRAEPSGAEPWKSRSFALGWPKRRGRRATLCVARPS